MSFLVVVALVQLASSPAYRLDDFACAGGSGGASSIGFAGHVALAPLSGAEVLSPAYRATLGFLGAWDPEPTNAPVIFGITPPVGPLAGGTPLTIVGLNFGSSVSVSIGGNPASGVTVASDTLLTCVDPPGSAGAKSVSVTSSVGSDTLAAAFTYDAGLFVYGTGTPGCTGPELPGALSSPTLGNAAFRLTCDHAPPNALGLGLIANAQDVAGSDPFGIGALLHLNVLTATELLSVDFTSDASGFATAPAPIPANPFYLGLNYYAQVLWVRSSCSLPPYGFSSSRGLRVTVEP